MTWQPEQYSFVSRNPALGAISFLPALPFQLTLGQNSVQTTGVLDTTATVNVLPFDIGIQLGAEWEKQTVPVRLTGNLANEEARGLLATANIGKFPSVQLAFAWSKSNAVPLLLGQVNFFMEFDVCFYRAKLAFELKPKAAP